MQSFRLPTAPPNLARAAVAVLPCCHDARTCDAGGLLGFLGLAAGFFANPAQFYRSYLVAFVFVLGVTLGSLAISMLHHMSGGAWGLVIRRI